MVTGRTGTFLQRLRGAMLMRDGGGLTDGQLLHDYLRRGDGAALPALVLRHGPMVWGVCRRVLRDHHAAEDAFQATFLVLVRRAAAIASPELLASWLYGVAHRTALKARATAARRRAREQQVAQLPEPAAADHDPRDELLPLLDQELSRLPELYRVAVILCDLEGKTRREAARQLGIPEGTVAARLVRGRRMLGKRLARRGLSVLPATLAVALARGTAAAAVPSPLLAFTMKGAMLAVSGGPAPLAGFSLRVAALADGVARGTPGAAVKTVAAVLLAVGAAVGLGWSIQQPRGADAPTAAAANPVAGAEPAAANIDPVLRPLQGTWVAVASELDGLKDFDRRLSQTRLVFVGDRVTYWVAKGPQEGQFHLDPSRTPRAIDIEFDSGATLRGIYEFDGARLRFCWTKGGRRPASFDTAAGEMLTFLYTFEKQL